ncbi:MAG: hypothetical protein VXX53_01585, partial [Pseudomonadota bacterium]|nr:hypothetical protein [Pseudomonadota bacterium]
DRRRAPFRPGPGEAVIQAKIPYILDAYITYIHALAALDIKPGVADRQFLKERLLVKTKEIVGGDMLWTCCSATFSNVRLDRRVLLDHLFGARPPR